MPRGSKPRDRRYHGAAAAGGGDNDDDSTMEYTNLLPQNTNRLKQNDDANTVSDKKALLQKLAGVNPGSAVNSRDYKLGSASGTTPLMGQLQTLTGTINSLMLELQYIRAEIYRRVVEEASGTRQQNSGTKAGGLTPQEQALRELPLDQLLRRGKGFCESIQNVIHDLREEQTEAKTPAEKQMVARSITMASQAFKEALTDFLDLESRYRDMVNDQIRKNGKQGSSKGGASSPTMTNNYGAVSPPGSPAQMGASGNLNNLQMQTQKGNNRFSMKGGNMQGIQQQYYIDEETQKLHNLLSVQESMKKFEQEINQLAEMVEYCAAVQQEQTELLASIENHVDVTDEFIGAGVIKLHEAEEHQANYMNKRLWLFWAAAGTCSIMLIILVIMSFCWFGSCCVACSDGSNTPSGGSGGTTTN
ncbi:unnamed protein product [Amoebophrya sp. A120]|nr:unnamed protein product [Amoebophrya sp. A120]|eukprot:GSA120T00013851001.1